jgi:hypothetical protein
MPGASRDVARRANVVAAYIDAGDGVSFAAVGRRFGISGERVRQYVVEYERDTGEKVPRLHVRRTAPQARPPRPSAAQRLLRHVRFVATCECWEWTGRTSAGGHPLLSAEGESYANRLAYKLWCGPVPSGFHVVPSCARQACVSPFHLVALSPGAALRFTKRWDQARDALRPRTRQPWTHCRRGHELTPENIEWNHSSKRDGDGRLVAVTTRLCRICARARRLRYEQSRDRRGARDPSVA